MASNKEFLTCRRILWLMVILSYILQHMLRVNISMAILAMSNTTNHIYDETEKNNVLGIFFWGLLFTPMVGGRLAEIYGTRVVLGTSMLLSSILTLLTPAAFHFSYLCTMIVRFCLGLNLGVAGPSFVPLATKWIPPTDTSKFISNIDASYIGVAITLAGSGILIEYLDWPSVFYATGSIGLLWCCFWFYLVYDSPKKHPRISTREREDLNEKIQEKKRVNTRKAPWFKILTSGPVWAITVAHTCAMFNTNLLSNYLPMYMRQVLHFDITENGLLSSLPFLGTYFMALLSSFLADRWKASATFATRTIRRIFTGLYFLVWIMLLLVQCFLGYVRIVAVTVFVLLETISGCIIPGHISNVMDICPIYSATVFGLIASLGGFTGYLSSLLVSMLVTEDENVFEHWRCIFWIVIGANFFGLVFNYCFMSVEVQKWNTEKGEMEMKSAWKETEEQFN